MLRLGTHTLSHSLVYNSVLEIKKKNNRLSLFQNLGNQTLMNPWLPVKKTSHIKVHCTKSIHFFLLNTFNYMLQYWAKLMKTIIDEYRQNRDISASFNEILFGTKYRAISRDIYCSSCREISPSRVRYFVTSKRNFVATQRNIVHTQ